ncbi:uncharacterized protein LOC126742131 [Anthonomus grandis grandis]|uniref:uncharacterized protein LOC126742131 n=1 Tax=Anthonomus grandis grandis TaxID=2921223 RepID=UPI002166ABAF|nr:uncharacterized protein LOC126742131 [Anthonomus grandis grandis]
MAAIDVELFITEVEERPALYNTKQKEYSDKNLKKKLWTELCEKFIENWNELGDKEKNEKGNELQKRWKNLRTCFKREYDAQKNIASGSGAKKRRKYLYFEQLLFLRDSIESRISYNSLEQGTDDVEDNTETREEESEASEATQLRTGAKTDHSRKKIYQKKTHQKTYEESLLQILREKKDTENEIDEDKYFLLSLLPSLKKFNEDQKFIARTEILNVIRRVRMSGSGQNQIPPEANALHHQNTAKSLAVNIPSTSAEGSHYGDYRNSSLHSPTYSYHQEGYNNVIQSSNRNPSYTAAQYISDFSAGQVQVYANTSQQQIDEESEMSSLLELH